MTGRQRVFLIRIPSMVCSKHKRKNPTGLYLCVSTTELYATYTSAGIQTLPVVTCPKCGFLFVIEYLIGHIKCWLLQVSLPSVLSSGYSHISCSICTVSRTSVEQVRIGGSHHCSLQCCYRTHQVRHRSFQKVGERELKRNTKT